MTDSEEIRQANKLKLLAEFYRRLEDLEKGFERLEKETGRLMLAENAEDNFDAYYKFVNPVSRDVDNIKNLLILARSALQKYRQLDDPKFKPKSLWSSSKENSKADTASNQLEKRIDALEFKVQIIIAVLVALFVMLALD